MPQERREACCARRGRQRAVPDLCGLFAFAAAAIIRNTAATITAMIGLLFVVPVLVNMLPDSWQNDLVRWLPTSAGRATPRCLDMLVVVRNDAHVRGVPDLGQIGGVTLPQ